MVEAGVGETVYNDKLGVFNVHLKLWLKQPTVTQWHGMSVNCMLIWPVFMLPLKVTPWIALCTFPLRYFTLHLTVHFWSQKKTGNKTQHCESSGKERWVKRDPEAKKRWRGSSVWINFLSEYVQCVQLLCQV